MLSFPRNTCLIEYENDSYFCDEKVQVKAPLNLDTMEEVIRQCPELQQVSLKQLPFGDECFPLLAQLPRLNMLALSGKKIRGHGLSLLKDLPVKQLFLQRTSLDDEGLAQAAQIRKLETFYIAACHDITFEGLMGIAWRDGLSVIDQDEVDEEGRRGLFTEEQKKAYKDAQAYKCVKEQLFLTDQELREPIAALQAFFAEMTQWEEFVQQNGLDHSQSKVNLQEIFSKRVSGKPRSGFRPLSLSCRQGGTYRNHRLIMGEKVTKNKFWIYTEEYPHYYRYLMQKTEEGWKIRDAKRCWNGVWKFTGL